MSGLFGPRLRGRGESTGRDGSRSNPCAGFTLIEVSLALALIGLITALALPRVLPGTTSTDLRAKAFEIAALLRADRNAALRTGRPVATDVDLVARRVRSSISDHWIALPQSFTVRLATAISGGFRFYPDGTSSGGQLLLAMPDAELAIQVNEITAAVSIRRGAAAAMAVERASWP